METAWFIVQNPMDLTEVMYFAKFLLRQRIPFSVEYEGIKVGFTGFSMEKHQLAYWKK